MAAIVIAEHDSQILSHTTLAAVTAALSLKMDVSILVIGFECGSVAEQAANLEGIKEVILIDNVCFQHFLAENLSEAVVRLAPAYSHLLTPATTFGKNFMPRVAGLLGLGQASDIVQILDDKTFIRPIYAGNALETIELLDPIKIITVRVTSFEKAAITNEKAPIRKEEIVFDNTGTKFIEKQATPLDRPELTAAKIIISGGRGLQSAENFKLLEQLAKQLGAAIGASRAAVDAGFVPNDYQVGQTGKVVAPDLYIAIGISGAIQHIAGMKESKIIVAINKDPDAPIFAIADYGLVGDLFKILPELQEELTKLGYKS